MSLGKDIILRIISGVVSIIGLIILIKSVNIGNSLANVRYRIEEYITTFRLLGAILLTVGSFSALRK
ncbi:MAG: hypothetical protein FH751_12840 [Firmicutes bacterium]|nr:hypothetical protein [Bacillota bacterium]